MLFVYNIRLYVWELEFCYIYYDSQIRPIVLHGLSYGKMCAAWSVRYGIPAFLACTYAALSTQMTRESLKLEDSAFLHSEIECERERGSE